MNTLECIKTRHSTRKFKPEPVAQELLDTVIVQVVARQQVAIYNLHILWSLSIRMC